MNLREESILDIGESDLITRLLRPEWRHRILEIYGMPSDAMDFQGVSLAGVPHEEDKGDVDILFFKSSEPQQSVAIEVKRVKFGSQAIVTLRPNKIHELTKGVEQSNRLARIGFSQVYFFPFVVVDSREQNAGQKSYAGTSVRAKAFISQAMNAALSALDSRIGMYCCEFTQPTDCVPLGEGSFHGDLRRIATAIEQPRELTQWVSETPERCAMKIRSPFC